MKKFMAILASLALLVGCTAAPAQEQASTPAESEAVESTVETSSEEAQPDEAQSWPRTIVDATGNEIVLEKKPERVSLLHIVYLEHLLALGAPPTAAALGNWQGAVESLEASELLWPHLKDTEITMLGNSSSLSPEAVLASQPDVILTFHNPAGLDQYDQLVEIAPVVQISYSDSWQDQLRLCAQVVGLEEKAEEIIKSTEATIAQTKEALAPYADRSFALFRTDGKSFIAQGMSAYYNAFGLTKPEGFTEKAESLSLEAVAEMNPYYIVFQHNLEVATTFVGTMENNSVWQSLDAVKNGRVFYFDENMNSYGPLTFVLGAEKLTELYTK